MHGPNRHCPRTALPRRAARAFSLVELLVVIAVIGLLIAAVVGIANAAIHNQKVRNTRAIMNNVTLAIDQFKAEDPLRLVYNGRNPTFGPYPPYQLRRTGGTKPSAWRTLEVNPPGGNLNLLSDRLWRDVGHPSSAKDNWIDYDDSDQTNDDIRALYAYLRLYMRSALSNVPDSVLKPLTSSYEWVNPADNSLNPEAQERILGIHDAWGVPFDYFLYVKLEYGHAGWRIADRIPVLRSRGISRDVYDVQQQDNTAPRDPSKWIFSTAFPSPPASLSWPTGAFVIGGGSAGNGWARAVAHWEDYGYYPDLERDGNPP